MVHGTLSEAVFLVFDNSAFEEREALKALDVVLVATESAGPRPGSSLVSVAPSFYPQVVAAGADFGYVHAGLTAMHIEVLLFSPFVLELVVEPHFSLGC